MNELPDLSPKIQVGLFNVLEERDIQIRGFTVRLPLDLCLVFSANPEDYTNRGRIVTPLKDRIGSVVSTHYPTTRDLGVTITTDNAWTERNADVAVFVPTFIRSVLEETSRLARTSPHVNQASGISVRMSIANLENAVSNAERRGLLHEESHVVVGIHDLTHIAPSARGKMELAMSDEPGEEDRLVNRLLAEAIKNVFDESFKPKQFRSLVEHFESAEAVVVGDASNLPDTHKALTSLPGIGEQLSNLAAQLEPELPDDTFRPALEVSVAGFILDALHHHNRLNRRETDRGQAYGL
jgi:magnesium chelatase subunit I